MEQSGSTWLDTDTHVVHMHMLSCCAAVPHAAAKDNLKTTNIEHVSRQLRIACIPGYPVRVHFLAQHTPNGERRFLFPLGPRVSAGWQYSSNSSLSSAAV